MLTAEQVASGLVVPRCTGAAPRARRRYGHAGDRRIPLELRLTRDPEQARPRGPGPASLATLAALGGSGEDE